MVQGCTEKNVADLNTKSLSLRRRQSLLRRCGCRGDGIPEGDDDEIQLGGQQKRLVRAVAALLAVHLQGCGKDSSQGYQGVGSHTVRIDLDEKERNIRRNNVNYLMMVAMTVMFAVVISWRFTTTYLDLFSKDNSMDLVYNYGFDIKDVEATTTWSSRKPTWSSRRPRWRPRTTRATRTSDRKVCFRVRGGIF